MEKLMIKVGARASALSKAQVQEVYQEIRQHHPNIEFDHVYTETTGDKDRLTSLRNLGKTNFFTKEIDDLLLKGECRIAIHSAKDLPEPIPEELMIAAITHGVDQADVLVMREGENVDSLPMGARIATSSQRREEQVKSLRNDFVFCDLRGTIEERLALLEGGKADGVVVAEAALIRLGLMNLNRLRLQGDPLPYQGQLAILCRKDDSEMLALFHCLDSRQKKRKILYLGLELPENIQKHEAYIHYPIIRIEVRPPTCPDIQNCFEDISDYTHILFTSKSAVHAFFRDLAHFGYKIHHLVGKEVICVGQQTAKALGAYGIHNPLISAVETAEGMVDFLEGLSHKNPYYFWPHSALSRSVISDYLKSKKLRFKECAIYDTVINKSLYPVDLSTIDEIYFTSPSTIDAYLKIYGSLPADKALKAIGPITEQRLKLVKIDGFVQNDKEVKV